jgi:hypothetical protein
MELSTVTFSRYISSETHSAEDVPVYAQRPTSNLFSGVYDHNYIAHAACIGPHAICNVRGGATRVLLSYSMYILTSFIHFCILALKII